MQSCDPRQDPIDRAQLLSYSSGIWRAALGDRTVVYCDHSARCASADRQQTDYTAIERSQWGILNIPKFHTATKMATRPDHTATVLGPRNAIWSKTGTNSDWRSVHKVWWGLHDHLIVIWLFSVPMIERIIEEIMESCHCFYLQKTYDKIAGSLLGGGTLYIFK